MKVLALVTDGFGSYGGIGTYNKELLNALAERDDVSHVEVLPRYAGEKPAHAMITQRDARRSTSSYVCHALLSSIKDHFDWVFCGHINHLPLARLVALFSGAKIWLQLHGIEAWQRPNPIACAALAHCHLVTTVSRVTRARFLSWCNVEPQCVKVLSNTFASAFTIPAQTSSIRERYQLGSVPLILTVSRLQASERYKGHTQVMLAMLETDLQSGPAPHYLIAGRGDDQAFYQHFAQQLGLEDRVHFLGEISSDELHTLYRSVDVFAMPSTGEGFGIVFLEAIACGLSVVAGDRDGARDALRDGLLGALVDPDNPREIAQAIAKGIANNDAAKNCAHHQPRTTNAGLEVFSREQFRQQLQAIFGALAR